MSWLLRRVLLLPLWFVSGDLRRAVGVVVVAVQVAAQDVGEVGNVVRAAIDRALGVLGGVAQPANTTLVASAVWTSLGMLTAARYRLSLPSSVRRVGLPAVVHSRRCSASGGSWKTRARAETGEV